MSTRDAHDLAAHVLIEAWADGKVDLCEAIAAATRAAEKAGADSVRATLRRYSARVSIPADEYEETTRSVFPPETP